MKEYGLALHLFRRDLRLYDNTALIYALENSENVVPCFIIDKRQVQEANEFRSNNAIQFMKYSLVDLDGQLRKNGGRLYLFYGISEEIVGRLIKTMGIDLVTVNRDYTPFSRKRDLMIESVCKRNDAVYSCRADALLNEPEDVFNKNRNPYTLFTPFFNRSRLFSTRDPVENEYSNYYTERIDIEEGDEIYTRLVEEENSRILLRGGRGEALKLLGRLSSLARYESQRSFPSEDCVTHLSAHNKFGTISIRELYHRIRNLFGKSHALIRELYWRDFFTHIAYHFPHVFGNAFHKRYDSIRWANNQELFNAWCEGRTGFPIVDAGMRELNATGYMHNRTRMITASFLVKDLQVDWRWGERYFAQHLTDYDPSVNNGNWQWVASTGSDAQPYFRIFNPWSQQVKFDPDCRYIRKWVPELLNLLPEQVHNLEREKVKGYPAPIINHREAAIKAKAMFTAKKP